MARILASDISKCEGQEVELSGWVDVARAHGKILFVDLRDRSGIAQLVFLPPQRPQIKSENERVGAPTGASEKPAELYAAGMALRPEWVVSIKGTVNKRPEGMQNKNIPSGRHEVQVEEIEVLSKSETPPIPIDTDGYEIGEETRMQYRYLDLRRKRLQLNIKNRAKVVNFMRSYLTANDFIEIETPIISKSTPEGARDYLVPSRIYPGNFYALPQSPQQYKQLLMVAGFERYFQIARCFRDEDTRGDRQPEFTQLDIEMSFVTEEEVINLIENMYVELIEKLYPQKKIQTKPFPRLTYKESMEKYGIDRPDLRVDKNDPNELAFCWITNFPFFERVEDERSPKLSEDGSAKWTFTHNPFSAPKPEHMKWLMNKERIGEIITAQYDIVLNGLEIGGGSIRNHNPDALKKVFEIMGFDENRIMKNFGHMIQALGFGAPPHGGIASGIDRLMLVLQNEPNIREVIAFPKTGDGRDLMMQAPSEVSPEQLEELGLKMKQKKQQG